MFEDQSNNNLVNLHLIHQTINPLNIQKYSNIQEIQSIKNLQRATISFHFSSQDVLFFKSTISVINERIKAQLRQTKRISSLKIGRYGSYEKTTNYPITLIQTYIKDDKLYRYKNPLMICKIYQKYTLKSQAEFNIDFKRVKNVIQSTQSESLNQGLKLKNQFKIKHSIVDLWINTFKHFLKLTPGLEAIESTTTIQYGALSAEGYGKTLQQNSSLLKVLSIRQFASYVVDFELNSIIKHLPKIEVLRLIICAKEILDPDFELFCQYLSRLKNLKVFLFDFEQFKKFYSKMLTFAYSLSNCKQLVHLQLELEKLESKHLSSLSLIFQKLILLESLHLNISYLTGQKLVKGDISEFANNLIHCKKLKQFNFSTKGIRFGQEFNEILQQAFPELTSITLKQSHYLSFDLQSITYLGHLNLRRISLEFEAFGRNSTALDQISKAISKCKNLEYFKLSYQQIPSKDIDILDFFNGLSSCSIIEEVDIKFLNCSIYKESQNRKDCDCILESIGSLSYLKNLQLNFAGNSFITQDLTNFGKTMQILTNLKHLHLNMNHQQNPELEWEEFIQQIINCKNLTKLALNGSENYFDLSTFQNLVTQLSNCPKLETLILGFGKRASQQYQDYPRDIKRPKTVFSFVKSLFLSEPKCSWKMTFTQFQCLKNLQLFIGSQLVEDVEAFFDLVEEVIQCQQLDYFYLSMPQSFPYEPIVKAKEMFMNTKIQFKI